MDYMTDNYFLEMFQVKVEDMERLIATAKGQGADYADLYFENTSYNELTLKDGIVSAGGYHIDYGVGIRALNGDRTGYAYSESTSMPDMIAAAKAAATIGIIGSGDSQSVRPCVNPAAQRSFYPATGLWSSRTNDKFLPLMQELEKKIRLKDSRVEKVTIRLSRSESDVMMYNSFGELRGDSRPLASLVASVIFQSKGKTEQKTVSRSFRLGPDEFFAGGTEGGNLIDTMASEVCQGIDERFEAIRPKGGEMPVVMGCGASGILLHEAMGHAFEADLTRKGQSIFEGRLGQRVCAEGINILDDATLEGNRGSCTYDDEGVAGQKTYMVRDGVLESFLHDRVSAAFYGVAPTGNGRRESFRFNPIPRMRATYMESGQADPQSIIASVSKGIYVDEFANGQVKIGEGDFTFYVKSGRLIENGRLTAPVKDINIIGNGPEALADIIAVGNDLKIDNGTWTCGKEQSAPVSCGIPTVLVKSLTVGGE